MTKAEDSPSETKTVLASEPLDEFWRFVKDFHNVYARIAKMAIAVPLVDLVLNLGPPWPSRTSVATSIVLVQVLVLMCSFAIWRQGKGKLYHVKAWLVASASSFLILFLLFYIPLFATFVVDAPDQWNRIIRGHTLQNSIQEFATQDEKATGTVWTARKLIAHWVDASTDETGIWTPGSVYTMRAVLLGVWLLVSLAYALAVSAFVALQYRRIR